MMEKSDFIRSNELGSMVEYRMDGMISGERKILRLSESTHGGIQWLVPENAMLDGELMLSGVKIQYLQKFAI